MSSETTEDSFPLLHLTELVSRAPLLSSGVATGPLSDQHDPCIIVRRLHTDDAVVLDTLSPEDVQDWCLFRIGEYRARISTLRSRPDSLMYNASLHGSIVQLKSNMCALRTVYNDAAPIHRNLPPEILLEIFANFHHNGTRWGHAASRVCHYWHDLLQRTPQFWKSLLDREFLGNWELPWKTARFGAAFFKSAPLDLSLRLRGIVPATVDIFAPHLRRISSMTIRVVGHPEEWEALDRFLRLDITEMRELEVRLGHMGSFRTPPIHITPFSPLPHLHTLRLSYMPVQPMTAPLPLLRHLELKDCLDSSPLRYLDLRTILTIMRNSPNLETIFIASPSRITLSDLEPPVNLPRLRHVNLQLSSESTCALLSYLVFPWTAFLDLKPRMTYAPHNPLPLSSSLVTPLGQPPTTEVAMDLQFTHRRTIATWEAQPEGGESRPLRISHDSLSEDHPDSTLAFTEKVLAVYAPGTTVTSLTVGGARRAGLKSYWTAILTGLPHLTRLAVDGGDVRDSPMLLPLLAKAQSDQGCLCPRLADLSVFWDERSASSGATWARTTVELLSLEGIDESGYPPLPLTNPPVDKAPFQQPYELVVTYAYCRFLELCLRSRAEHGCCLLRTLSVSIWDYWRNWSRRRNVSCEAALAVEAILREGLGDLVEEVFVKLQSEWEV